MDSIFKKKLIGLNILLGLIQALLGLIFFFFFFYILFFFFFFFIYNLLNFIKKHNKWILTTN